MKLGPNDRIKSILVDLIKKIKTQIIFFIMSLRIVRQNMSVYNLHFFLRFPRKTLDFNCEPSTLFWVLAVN
jgi:hypothetical protein